MSTGGASDAEIEDAQSARPAREHAHAAAARIEVARASAGVTSCGDALNTECGDPVIGGGENDCGAPAGRVW